VTFGSIACVVDEDVFAELQTDMPTDKVEDLFVLGALRTLSSRVVLVPALEYSVETLKQLADLRPSVIVNLAFSACPAEASFAGALELLGIPFTGSGPAAVALANDKIRSRRLLRAAGIQVPEFFDLSDSATKRSFSLEPPFIVKPVMSGNGVGVFANSIVHSYAEAMRCARQIQRDFGKPAVCDEFIVGREFHVGLIESPTGFKVSAIVELDFAGAEPGKGFQTGPIRNGSAVARAYKVTFRVAALSRRQATEIARVSRQSAQVLGLRGYSKVDIRMAEDGRLYVIEVNSNPGLWAGDIWSRPNFKTNLRRILNAARLKLIQV
jgi:D-alanine-D-alanine ligase